MTGDTRTAEQIQADEALTQALQNCIKAYFGINHSVGDYVIAASTQYLDENGTLMTDYPLMLRDGDLPWYRALGLLNIAEGIAKTKVFAGEDSG